MPYPLRPLDVASGMLLGLDPAADELPPAPGGMSPRGALEQAVIPALRRPPCLVAFSGGRDSSVVLAAAVRVARRETLPEPVPATLRFPGVDEAEESRWQEVVVQHLGAADWVRIDLGDELDIVGPLATTALNRHGLLFPPNSHLVLPLAEIAEGGSLLTGLDGDGLLESWRWQRGLAVLRGRVPPSPRNIARLGLALAPARVKAAVLRRRPQLQLPWLQPEASHDVETAAVAEALDEPNRWDARVAWWHRSRHLRALLTNVDLLCSDHGVQGVHPLSDPIVMAAMAKAGGRWGFGTRTEGTRRLAGRNLGDEIIERSDKATFSDVYWNRHARDFVDQWSGEGVDTDLVDPAALYRVWKSQRPDFRSALLLQSAWRTVHDVS